jgi:tRNA-specific 2-thiouridylase
MLSKKPTKVLVAMSGGVDSSVAALLMKKKGYEVIGAFMKNYTSNAGDSENDLGECTWKDDRREAMKIASQLKIPLITLDFEKQYRKEVIDEMFKLYNKGITPNPDIDCNQKIKFPLLWKAAKKLGADFIVTGHYARIKKSKAGYSMLRGKDESKDQSYFLYRLKEKDLAHSLFPIGDYTKKEIRRIAEKNKFPNFNRKGTVGICFVGKVNLKEFLQKKIKPKKGRVLSPEGKQIGEHDGIYYYTIGQRLGPRFGVEVQKGRGKRLKRWYVARKNLEKNEIIAAPEGHKILYRKEIVIKNPHWINEIPDKNKTHNLKARIRQVGELLICKLSYNKSKKQYKATLKKPITGVSSGQAIVLYQGKNVLGGGVINFD